MTLRHLVLGLALVIPGCAGKEPPCRTTPVAAEVGTICDVENPEDLELAAQHGIVLISQIRIPGRPGGGSIAALVPGTRTPRPLWRPDAADGTAECPGSPPRTFSPAGMAIRPMANGTSQVAVISHADDDRRPEAVDLFDLTGTGTAAHLVWRSCVPLPEHVVGNDVAIASNGDLFVTNAMPNRSPRHALRATLCCNTGDVQRWTSGSWQKVEGSNTRFPNGIVVSPKGDDLFFSETGSGLVRRLPLTASGHPPAETYVGGQPDNLSWADGGLLVASHDSALAFTLCALRRSACHSPWHVYRLDPETMNATPILAGGDTLGAVSSAVQVGPRLYLGAVFGDRLGVTGPPSFD